VSRVEFGGQQLAAQQVHVTVPARTNKEVTLVDAFTNPADGARELLVASDRSGSARRAYWYFAEDIHLDIPALNIVSAVETVTGGVTVSIEAIDLVKDLMLNPDRLDPDAAADEQFITLLPGEKREIHVTTARDLDITALTRHPVLTSVNQLLHPHS
jgi:beta-mannosidase